MISRYFFTTLLIAVPWLLTTCRKIERITKVNTETVENITDSSVTAKAFIVDINEDALQEVYGFCFSTINANPTINDTKVSIGKLDKKGGYSNSIIGLMLC